MEPACAALGMLHSLCYGNGQLALSAVCPTAKSAVVHAAATVAYVASAVLGFWHDMC